MKTPEMIERAVVVDLVAALEQAEAFLERIVDAARGDDDITPASIQISMNTIFELSAEALSKGRAALLGEKAAV